MKTSNIAHKSIIRVLLIAAVILSLPLLAMQVTSEVVWTLGDFVIAGALLVGTGLLYEAAVRRAGSLTYRAAVAVALGAGLFLVWAILAVGAIGAEGDPADLMYVGVLAMGIVGALIVRLRPEGMARVLLVMALAVVLVAVVALVAGKHLSPESSVVEIVGVNGFFAALFIGSAWLFRRAALEQPRAGSAPMV